MTDLTVWAPAKINLHLEVLGLRPDGFHELAMLMQSIDLLDGLEFAPAADARIRLSCDRPDLPTDGSNLIVRAAELLRSRSGLPELGARIHLRKRIPVGAGLAGGSSDGAAALVGLNALWGLGCSGAELRQLAGELGSDMPFCLDGGTQLCFGRGERLEPVPEPPAAGMAVLLLKHPQASVSTPWAYGRCRELRGDGYLADESAFEQRRQALRRAPLLAALAAGQELPPLRNDLQGVVEPDELTVRQSLQWLRELAGPLAVAMSGSGPSVFAVFADLETALAAQEQLAGALETGGFESWCCLLRRQGVSLER